MIKNKSFKPNSEPVITRTIKVAYYKVRVWNDETEEMETRREQFFDALSERDVKKLMENRLASENAALAIVKLNKEGETVYKTKMTLERYFELADKEVVELAENE